MSRSTMCLAAAAVLAFAATAGAGSPTPTPGDMYFGQGVNFPNDYGPSPLFYNGVPELLGGPTPDGMNWNESDTFLAAGTWPTGLPTLLSDGTPSSIAEYAGQGTIVEFAWSTEDGGPYNDEAIDPNDAWAVGIGDLDFGTPIALYNNTVFGYFTNDGVPFVIPPVLLFNFGVESGPHPTDPNISQVIFFRDPDDPVGNNTPFPDGKMLFAFDNDGDANAQILEIFLGATVNDLHMGVMIVPEPSTVALLALGGTLCVWLRRRRRTT